MLTSRDIRLKACRLNSSFAISAGDEGEDPSSSLSKPDRGICVDSEGGGDGGRNRGRLCVGPFRSGDEELLSEEELRWYADPCGVDCTLEFEYDEFADELDLGFGGGGGGRTFFRGGMGDL